VVEGKEVYNRFLQALQKQVNS